jgi:hypothetical protein
VPVLHKFTFACAIWKKPWMWCGGDTYVSNLIEAAGGTNVLRDQNRYPAINVGDIRADVIFLPDEPYVFTEEDAAAIKHARVIGPFPGHLVTWHGSRTILGPILEGQSRLDAATWRVRAPAAPARCWRGRRPRPPAARQRGHGSTNSSAQPRIVSSTASSCLVKK